MNRPSKPPSAGMRLISPGTFIVRPLFPPHEAEHLHDVDLIAARPPAP